VRHPRLLGLTSAPRRANRLNGLFSSCPRQQRARATSARPAVPDRLPGAHDGHHRLLDPRRRLSHLPASLWQNGVVGHVARMSKLCFVPRLPSPGSRLTAWRSTARWTSASAPSSLRSASSALGRSSRPQTRRRRRLSSGQALCDLSRKAHRRCCSASSVWRWSRASSTRCACL
jgi:hypothetical protein